MVEFARQLERELNEANCNKEEALHVLEMPRENPTNKAVDVSVAVTWLRRAIPFMPNPAKTIPTCTEPFSRCLDCDERGGCERYREHRGNVSNDVSEGSEVK
jgi:hypothetical protein